MDKAVFAMGSESCYCHPEAVPVPQAKQAWLTMSGLCCLSPSCCHECSHSFYSQWGEISTHSSDPTALKWFHAGTNLCCQTKLELACQRVLCLFHSGHCERRSVHMGNMLCVGCYFTPNPQESQIGNSTSSDTFTGGSHYPFITAI